MNLNIDIIADSLRKNYELIQIEVKHKELTFEQVVIYTDEVSFLPARVYVAEGGQLPQKPFFEDFCAIVSIGKSSHSFIDSDCDYIELEAGLSLAQVVNSIQDIFNKYNRWFLDMKEAVINEQGIQKLIDLTLPILGNPIYLHDKAYHFIGFAEPPNMPTKKDPYQINKCNGRFPRDLLDQLKDTPFFENTFKTTKPTFYIDKGDVNYIYDNIWYHGEYWGRLFVDESVKPFDKGDYAIIEILRKMIEKILTKRNLFPEMKYRLLEKNLIEMLEGYNVDRNCLEEELKQYEWDICDTYFCIKLQMEKIDLMLNTMVNTCEVIELELGDCIAFPYQEEIIGLVHIDGASDTLRRIKRVLKKLEYAVGISMPLTDFRELPYYCKQAEIALKYGTKENKAEQIHRFEDYCFSYMLDCCTKELKPNMLYPPMLNKLIEHDQKKSTSYVETLRAFLENDLKAAQTMRALYVQRSTFLYRMERIEALLGTDFKDNKTKIHLLMAFQLMDREE
ncbi:PucR family transcriptional regulator [Hominibacterium faecale]|uniref:PucR family transcriptional regulator n=1 Tax=Hominibacterium faecale TaxID=2839743 RepID=UPI0022B2A683|nr:helix-turn-helix domain-containing protein [Hominibacterium faecale]